MSIDQSASTETKHGRRLAVVIGVNAISTLPPPPLRRAIDDAQVMAQVLHECCGFEILHLLLGEKATSTNVKDALLELTEGRDDNDFLLFYFSGHGLPIDKYIYLGTSDFNPRNAERDATRHLPMHWLRDKLYLDTNAGRVLLILDCCYAGNMGRTAPDPYLEELQEKIREYFGAPGETSGSRFGGLRFALTATGHNQAASESEIHGTMTHYLLLALQGKVNDVINFYTSDGDVSLEYIKDYLQRMMPETQKPALSGDSSGRDCILAWYKQRAEALRRQHLPHAEAAIKTRPTSYLQLKWSNKFQAREGEFAALEQLTFAPHAAGSTSVVGIVGLGGIGKSRLAAEFAHAYQERFPGGVFWTPATGTTEQAWLQHFATLALKTDYLPADDDTTLPDFEERRARHLCRYLASHPDALLVLDNVEQPELVLSLLSFLAGQVIRCTVLYTTRTNFSPPAFRVHHVTKLSEAAALRLLLSHRVDYLESAEPAEAEAARAICRMVDRLPQALIMLAPLLEDSALMMQHLQQVLQEKGTLAITLEHDPKRRGLFGVFLTSWDKVLDPNAQLLFKLACYFPEAVPIPLWLLGITSGLGEENTILEPLGKARNELQRLSLIELDENGQALRQHPLLREFGQTLVAQNEADQVCLQEAWRRLMTAFTDPNELERRTRAWGYWQLLERVQEVSRYAALPIQQLANGQADLLVRVEHWLARDSSVLGNSTLWPATLPALFYQQLYNHAVEESYTLPATQQPACWLRQMERVGAENPALLREFLHPDEVTCVAYAPDGRTIATGCADGIVRVWDINSGQLLRLLDAHTYSLVECVSYAPDGVRVAAGYNNKEVYLWDGKSGEVIQVINLGFGEMFLVIDVGIKDISSIIFSPDSTLLAINQKSGVHIWDIATEQFTASLGHSESAILDVAFISDSQRILIVPVKRHPEIWDIVREELVEKKSFGGIFISNIALSHSGTGLVSTDGEHLTLWDMQSGKAVLHFGMENEYLSEITFFSCFPAFSSDEQWFSIGFQNGVISIWNMQNGLLVAKLYEHHKSVTGLVFSPDGNYIVSTNLDGKARLYSLLQEDRISGMAPEPTLWQEVFADSSAIGFVDRNRLQLWELREGELLWHMNIIPYWDEIEAVACSKDKQQVIVCREAKISLYDLPTGNCIKELPDIHSRIKAACFAPDGDKIALGANDEFIYLWNLLDGKIESVLLGHQGIINALVFSPDGAVLVSGSTDGTARVWDAATYQQRFILKDHLGSVTSLCISPDSKYAATSSMDEIISLWSLADGRLLATWQLQRQNALITCMAFSPDGTRLLACDDSGRAMLWDVATPTSEQVHQPLALYTTFYAIRAACWLDERHIVLADRGGAAGKPHFYRLALEGECSVRS